MNILHECGVDGNVEKKELRGNYTYCTSKEHNHSVLDVDITYR